MPKLDDPNLLLDYLEGELSADEAKQVRELLKDDPAATALLMKLAEDRELTRSITAIDPPEGLRDDANEWLERQMLLDDRSAGSASSPGPISRWRIGPMIAYTGIAAVLILTTFTVIQSLTNPDAATTNGPIGQVAEKGSSGNAFDDAIAMSDREDELAELDRLPSTSPTDAESTEASAVTMPNVSKPFASDTLAEMQPGFDSVWSGDTRDTRLMLSNERSALEDYFAHRRVAETEPSFNAQSEASIFVDADPARPADVQLNIQTPQPERIQSRLETWAVSNSIEIVSAATSQPATFNQAKASKLAARQMLDVDTRPSQQQVRLNIDANQLADLVGNLDGAEPYRRATVQPLAVIESNRRIATAQSGSRKPQLAIESNTEELADASEFSEREKVAKSQTMGRARVAAAPASPDDDSLARSTVTANEKLMVIEDSLASVQEKSGLDEVQLGLTDSRPTLKKVSLPNVVPQILPWLRPTTSITVDVLIDPQPVQRVLISPSE